MNYTFCMLLLWYIMVLNVFKDKLVVLCSEDEKPSSTNVVEISLSADVLAGDVSKPLVQSTGTVQSQAASTSTSFLSEISTKLPLPIGKEMGITSDAAATNSVSQSTLQKIIQGVEHNNKESIYYFALLKLYGITVTQSLVEAAQYFHQAAELGHIEARTAYGVLHMIDSDQEVARGGGKMNGGLTKNLHVAMNSFKLAALDGDPDATWLIAKYVLSFFLYV